MYSEKIHSNRFLNLVSDDVKVLVEGELIIQSILLSISMLVVQDHSMVLVPTKKLLKIKLQRKLFTTWTYQIMC